MKRDEQLRMLLHPEKYTDEQLAQMLDEANIPVPDAKEEWARFKAATTPRTYAQPSKFKKIAAMFIGLLMLSGITYAAIQWLTSSPSPSQEENVETPIASTSSGNQASSLSNQKVSEDKTVVYENVELATLLSEMAAYYNYHVTYKNEDVKHIRLYFTWDKTKPIDDIVAMFNKFERFHITQEKSQMQQERKPNSGTLIVE